MLLEIYFVSANGDILAHDMAAMPRHYISILIAAREVIAMTRDVNAACASRRVQEGLARRSESDYLLLCLRYLAFCRRLASYSPSFHPHGACFGRAMPRARRAMTSFRRR